LSYLSKLNEKLNETSCQVDFVLEKYVGQAASATFCTDDNDGVYSDENCISLA